MEDSERFVRELLAFMEHTDAELTVADTAVGSDICGDGDTSTATCSDSNSTGDASTASSSDSSNDADCSEHIDTRSAFRASLEHNAPSATHTTTKRSKTTRNVTRDRWQRELQQLRAQRHELEQQLAALHTQRDTVAASVHATAPASLSSSEQLLLATWEHIAQRQLQQRARAEAENAHLRDRVARCAAIAASLQHTATYALRELAPCTPPAPPLDTCSLSPRVTLRVTPFADPQDVAIYEQLACAMDAAVARLDTIRLATDWRVGHLSSSSSLSSSVELKSITTATGASIACLEFHHVDVFPFKHDVVIAATRRIWEQRSLNSKCVVYGKLPPRTRNAYASKSRCAIAIEPDSVALDFLSVTRVVEQCDDSVAIVWTGLTKSDASFPDAVVDETGWQIIQRASDESATVVRTCSQLTPRQCVQQLSSSNREQHEYCNQQRVMHNVDGDSDNAAPLANFVLSALRVDIQQVNELVLDALLLQHATTESDLRI